MMNSIRLFRDKVVLPSPLNRGTLLCHLSLCSSNCFLSSCHLCSFVYPPALEYSVSVLLVPSIKNE